MWKVALDHYYYLLLENAQFSQAELNEEKLNDISLNEILKYLQILPQFFLLYKVDILILSYDKIMMGQKIIEYSEMIYFIIAWEDKKEKKSPDY